MAKTCILVIEDNIDNLDLIRFLLEQEGYEILTAMDGKNGLKICKEQKPEMVLLDLTLPEIDGWHLARLLKNSPDTSSIRVIAITAHVLPGDRERAFEAGCDGYITKPLDINNFPEMIKEYLSSK